MRLSEHDDVVKAFVTIRSVQPLDVTALPGRCWSGMRSGSGRCADGCYRLSTSMPRICSLICCSTVFGTGSPGSRHMRPWSCT